MMNRVPNSVKVAIAAAGLAAAVFGGWSMGSTFAADETRFAVDRDVRTPHHFNAHSIRDLFPH